MDSVRLLRPGDEGSLAAFFARHPDTTLFLQSNAAPAGLVDRGEPQQGSYVAAFGEDGAIEAVACHCWNGNLLVEAPVALAEVVRVPAALASGALLAARARGVARSVPFTPTGNAPAQAAYRALGYERVGDYALILFAEPQRVG